jgi:hypothetical protein
LDAVAYASLHSASMSEHKFLSTGHDKRQLIALC